MMRAGPVPTDLLAASARATRLADELHRHADWLQSIHRWDDARAIRGAARSAAQIAWLASGRGQRRARRVVHPADTPATRGLRAPFRPWWRFWW